MSEQTEREKIWLDRLSDADARTQRMKTERDKLLFRLENLDKKPEEIHEKYEEACAEVHRLGDMVTKDAKLNGKFLEDVRVGACLCEYPVVPKERCPVHGELAEANELCLEGATKLEEAAAKIDECADGLDQAREVNGVLHFHLRELRAETQKTGDGRITPKGERLEEADAWIDEQIKDAGLKRAEHGIRTSLCVPMESTEGTEPCKHEWVGGEFEDGWVHERCRKCPAERRYPAEAKPPEEVDVVEIPVKFARGTARMSDGEEVICVVCGTKSYTKLIITMDAVRGPVCDTCREKEFGSGEVQEVPEPPRDGS